MTVRSSSSAPATGWDRLQGLLDDFRAEQTQTEHFLAEMLDHLTQAVSASIEEEPGCQAPQPDPRVDQLIASAELHRAAVDEACRLAEIQAERFADAAALAQQRENELLQGLQQDRDSLRAAEVAAQLQIEQLADAIRKGFDELLDLARQRSAAEQALQESILLAIREERAAAAQTVAETVDAAVSGAVEKVVAHSLEQQASLVANSLAEHRSMMAPAADAVLDSIRVQFELLQRQTARRRQAKPVSRS